MIERISPTQLREELAADTSVPVVDTRGADSFGEWHIPGAINLPFSSGDTLSPDAIPDEVVSQDRAITICGKGISSSDVAPHLLEAGIGQVMIVDEGMEGWSQVYDTTEVDLDDDVLALQLQRVAKGCLSYIIACQTTAQAVVIDPPIHHDPVMAELGAHDLEVVSVIDTHVHADHVSGASSLAEHLDVPYVISERSSDRGLTHDHVSLADTEVFSVGELDVRAMATPGHTTDIMSLLLEDQAVFTGDTLFTDAVGRTELESADAAEDQARRLYHSLHERLLDLPDETVVLPGHFEPSFATIRAHPRPRHTTIGGARSDIDLLSEDEETFVDRIVDREASRPPNYEDIISLNLGERQLPPTDELIELELGPNRCAAPA